LTALQIARRCLALPQPKGNPRKATVVSAAAFGYGANPANRLLALFLLKEVLPLGIPLWVIQTPVLQALEAVLRDLPTLSQHGLQQYWGKRPSDLGVEIVEVRHGRRGPEKYVDTLDVNLETVQVLRERGLEEIVLEVAHFRHVLRYDLLFELLGVEGVIPEGLERYSCWAWPWTSKQLITMSFVWLLLTRIGAPRDVARMRQLGLIEAA